MLECVINLLNGFLIRGKCKDCDPVAHQIYAEEVGVSEEVWQSEATEEE